MLIDLRDAHAASFAQAVFDHEPRRDGGKPWFFGSVRFQVDAERQLALMAEVFGDPRTHLSSYSAAQIEDGLWCMASGCRESFTALVWSVEQPLEPRARVAQSVFALYDRLLAAAPHEAIDFILPDSSPRRFVSIDYMLPELLLDGPLGAPDGVADDDPMVGEYLRLFERLLAHPAPVAQYAALHGLGHLRHPRRAAVVSDYLHRGAELTNDRRTYAQWAREGSVL